MSIKSKTDELCSAIEKGDYKNCLELMADSSILNVRNFQQVRPLEKAAKYGQTDICIALLDRGADIEAVDRSGLNPLCLAAGRGYRETCIALLARGARLNSGTRVDEVPLYAAAANGYIEVCLALLDRGAQMRNDLLDDLFESNEEQSYVPDFDKCLLAFVAYGAEIPIYFDSKKTKLEAAALIGNGYFLNSVLNSDLDKDTLSSRVTDALQIAIDKDESESVAILSSWISRHHAYVALAEMEKDNKSKEEKIYKVLDAVKAGNISEIGKLISEGFDIDSIISDGREEMPLLCFAAIKDNNRVLLELIRLGANIEAKSASGKTALFSACSRMNGLHNLSALLEHGANIDAVDNYGDTPLIQASSVSLKDECLLLIERGAKLDIKNIEGKSALSGSVIRTVSGFKEIDNDAKDIFLALIDRGANIEVKDNNGCTPLYIAAKHALYDVLLVLVDRGADIEAKDNKGRTPLSIAVENGRVDTCLALLDRGADVNSKDNDGCAPLHAVSNVSEQSLYANSNLYLNICLALMDRGADIGAKDNDGMSVLSRAVSRIGELGYKKADDYATDICLALIANGASTTDNMVKVSGGGVSLQTLLEYAALKEQGVLITKFLEADSDPKTLPERAAKALQIANKAGKQESVAILSSWITRQAAMAALADFAEPTLKHTSH